MSSTPPNLDELVSKQVLDLRLIGENLSGNLSRLPAGYPPVARRLPAGWWTAGLSVPFCGKIWKEETLRNRIREYYRYRIREYYQYSMITTSDNLYRKPGKKNIFFQFFTLEV